MAHDTGSAVTAVMIVMMIVMGGFSLAALSRAVPAAWRERIRHGIRRSASLTAGTGQESAR
jgi:hypothetical protein